jgi:alpha-glucosidase
MYQKILTTAVAGIYLLFMAACGQKNNEKTMISSPDKKIELSFILENGIAKYEVKKDGKTIILPSKLGFKLKDKPALDSNFVVINQKISTFDETWEQPWGEVRKIRNNYTELFVELKQNDKLKRKINLIFRVFDYGIGFRYEIPEQENLKDFAIMDEETEFLLTGDHSAWWIPAYRPNRYEYLYTNSQVNKMDTVHTPVTMKTADGVYLSFHEAALTDYASMVICSNKKNGLKCDLVPWADGVKVYTKTPMKTPWRTIQIADKPGDLISSYLILNLNDSNKLGDVSYIEPGKYVGIWWGMHIGLYTWSSGPKHGATTANAIKYIDFAAKYGFSGVLIEGWNESWDGDWMQNGSIFSFTKPYPDFDIRKVTEYARSKGVKIIGHHETGADVDNYGKQMEAAYIYYKSYGIDIIKSGYVGSRMNKKEWHHGQFGVNFYHKALTEAAKYNIMLVVHEPIKETGKRRTYPNMMSLEGARGTEYDAWSDDGGNPPNHTTIIPFTRLLAGPMDFTPGVFDIMIKQKPNNRSNTTLAKQLAYYVTIYSPFQMACDLPENYEANLKPFQFIRDVVTDWDDTKVLNAEIGEYFTIVRKARNSNEWFLGSITNEKPREFEVGLSFLDLDKKYKAQIYADGPDADWKTKPLSIQISEIEVDSNSKLKIKLAPGGGQAIRFYPIK